MLPQKEKTPLRNYAYGTLIIAGCTLAAFPFRDHVDAVNLVMIYLVGVVAAAARFGRWPSLYASLFSVLCFNFFFTQPYYSFQFANSSYYFTFAVMLVTSLVISSLASKVRSQSAFFEQQARELNILYDMARELAGTRGHIAISRIAATHINKAFHGEVTLWLPDAKEVLSLVQGVSDENQAALWAYENQERTGQSTLTLPGNRALYVPLVAADKSVGVMGIIGLSNDQKELLGAFTSLIAASLARADASEIAERHRIDAEREQLRNTLLSSVSHDLRTPLASISGAASSLLLAAQDLPANARELVSAIQNESSRLTRIIANLLQVTRFESNKPQLNRQPYYIDELIGSALSRCQDILKDYKVETHIADELPLMSIDGLLIEQVLMNLLENAARYTPPQSTITLSATQTPYAVEVSVHDGGQGIAAGIEEKIFNKFYTTGQPDSASGTGLGLAICKSIIGAHQGRIWAGNAPVGGAIFTFSLPLAINAAKVEDEPA